MRGFPQMMFFTYLCDQRDQHQQTHRSGPSRRPAWHRRQPDGCHGQLGRGLQSNRAHRHGAPRTGNVLVQWNPDQPLLRLPRSLQKRSGQGVRPREQSSHGVLLSPELLPRDHQSAGHPVLRRELLRQGLLDVPGRHP